MLTILQMYVMCIVHVFLSDPDCVTLHIPYSLLPLINVFSFILCHLSFVATYFEHLLCGYMLTPLCLFPNKVFFLNLFMHVCTEIL